VGIQDRRISTVISNETYRLMTREEIQKKVSPSPSIESRF
jgi:hypothetical protein